MAELLRIKPIAPNLDPGQVRVPIPAAGFIGKGMSELGETVVDVFGKIEYGAAKAEAARSALEGTQEFKNILRQTAHEFSDRDEFKTEAPARLKEAYQRRLDAASKHAKSMVAENLSNELMQHVGKGGTVDEHYWTMTVDKATGDYNAAKAQLEQAAIGASGENQAAAGRMFARLVGDMTKSNFMKRDKAAEELVGFNKKVQAESMNLEAATDPPGFIRRQQEGAYKGNDSTAVQRALTIAASVGDARARKDAAEMKLASEAAERKFELDVTQGRQLDLAELDRTARYFGWDKDKVDGLKKMQIGLKVANPYEAAAIRDALRPVDTNAMYNMGDIARANSNLQALVKGGQADVRSPEYVAAVRHLQSLRKGLEITGSIEGRHSTFDARQEINDLYREFVRPNSKRQRDEMDAERSRALREVTDLPPARQREYTDNLRKKLEKGRAAEPQKAVPLDGLRSVPRR